MTDAERPGAERRRADRLEPGPLRVRLLGRWEGVLININTLGALVQLPIPQPVDSSITLDVDFDHVTLQLTGRVVRSNPFPVGGGRTDRPMASTDYYVAVEFAQVPASTGEILRGIVGVD